MDIHISSDNPHKKLRRIELAARTTKTVYLWSIPDHYNAVELALKRGDGHFRIKAHVVPSGVWIATIEPGHVPVGWSNVYEIYGIEGSARTFLGGGDLMVREPATENAQITPVDAATVLPMYDDEGVQHTVRLVKLDTGEYTLQVD